MPIWIEMRCADQDEDYAQGIENERCWSHDNAGCGLFGGETILAATAQTNKLFVLLRKEGWQRIKGHGWICPHCAAQRKSRAVARGRNSCVAIRQASLPGYDLGDYIKESIDFLRSHEPPEGYFVGFSGGKDSITTLELCRLAGVKHQAFYTYTTIDPPEVVRFIRAHYPQVHWLRPAKSFFACVATNAPPCACSVGAATISRRNQAGMYRLKAACLASAQRKAGVAQNVAASTFALFAKGAAKSRRAARFTPTITQYFSGLNGQYGNLSRHMACNTRHCMTKVSTVWAASAARIALEKLRGQSCSGQSQCRNGPAHGKLLNTPSSGGGTKNAPMTVRTHQVKQQKHTGETTSTGLKNKEQQPCQK